MLKEFVGLVYLFSVGVMVIMEVSGVVLLFVLVKDVGGVFFDLGILMVVFELVQLMEVFGGVVVRLVGENVVLVYCDIFVMVFMIGIGLMVIWQVCGVVLYLLKLVLMEMVVV